MAREIPERALYIIFFTILIFLAIVYQDFQFAILYFAFAVANAILYLFDSIQGNRVDFPFERPGNKLFKSALIGVFVYFAFRIISTIIFSLSDLQSVKLFAEGIPYYAKIIPTFGTEPVLFWSPLFYFLGWTLLVPLLETPFFNGRLYEGIVDIAKIDGKRFTLGAILVSILVGAIAAAFHLSVRLTSGTPESAIPGLVLTWVFFTISQLIVIYTGQTIDATIMHMVANGTAIIVTTGFVALTPLIPVLIALAVVVLLNVIDFKKIKFVLGG